jgi:hypothetical protein
MAMIPRRFAPLVLGSLAVGVLALALANFTGAGEEGGVGAFIVTVVLMIVVTAVLWNFLVTPRVDGPRTAAITGIVLGVLTILFVFIYWSGLPFALGPAAIALGILARERESEEAAAPVAIVLGILGLVLALVSALVDSAS